MAINPLAAGAAPTRPGPLSTRGAGWSQATHAAVRQQGWQPDDVAKHVQDADHVVPALGVLAKDPDVTRKKVIKATAAAAAANAIPAQAAVQFISALPEKPEELHGLLQRLYRVNLMGRVHLAGLQHEMAGVPLPGMPGAAQ